MPLTYFPITYPRKSRFNYYKIILLDKITNFMHISRRPSAHTTHRSFFNWTCTIYEHENGNEPHHCKRRPLADNWFYGFALDQTWKCLPSYRDGTWEKAVETKSGRWHVEVTPDCIVLTVTFIAFRLCVIQFAVCNVDVILVGEYGVESRVGSSLKVVFVSKDCWLINCFLVRNFQYVQ